MQYNEMSKEQLLQLKAELDERYKEAKAKGLNLNMSRGKPSATQLNVTMDMLVPAKERVVLTKNWA